MVTPEAQTNLNPETVSKNSPTLTGLVTNPTPVDSKVDPDSITSVYPLTPDQDAQTEVVTVDWDDLRAEIDYEMKRIGWSKKQGKRHLKTNYGVTARLKLTDDQLFEFLDFLKQQPFQSQ